MLLLLLAAALADNQGIVIDQNCVQTHYHYKVVPCLDGTPELELTQMALLPLTFTDGCYTAYGLLSLRKTGDDVAAFASANCTGDELATSTKTTTACFAVGERSFAVVYDNVPNYCPQGGLLGNFSAYSPAKACDETPKVIEVVTTTLKGAKYDVLKAKKLSVRLFVARDGSEKLQWVDGAVSDAKADEKVAGELPCEQCAEVDGHAVNLYCWKYHDKKCEILTEPNNCARMAPEDDDNGSLTISLLLTLLSLAILFI